MNAVMAEKESLFLQDNTCQWQVSSFNEFGIIYSSVEYTLYNLRQEKSNLPFTVLFVGECNSKKRAST